MKKLILITRRFPYYTTEAFLETEIKFLAKHFDQIVVYPSQIGEHIREVPKNVIVIDDFAFKFQNKKNRFFKTFFSSFFWKSIFENKVDSIKDIFLLFKYSSSYIIYYHFFSNQKEKLRSSVVYTYWLNEASHAFISFKENNNDFKVISRAHRFDIYEGLDSTIKFWPFREFVLKKIDSVYCISNDGKKYLEEKYATSKIKISKLGVIDREGLSLCSVKGYFSIVSVSRVEQMKRVDMILKSIYKFAEKHKELKVNWTHFGDGTELNKIKNQLTLPKDSNFNFQLMGNVKNEQIYNYYETSSVDLFINLSSSEGIPVSIMEAQSFGIPVIATNVGGSGEIVNSSTGILLKSMPSVDEVVKAIETIIELDFNRSTIKKTWSDNFNAETNYNNFSKSLLELI